MRALTIPVLVWFAASAVLADPASAPTAPVGPRLDWLTPDGHASWSLPLAATGSATPEGALSAAPWHKKLPPLDVRLLGGEKLRLAEARGSVLALTFWATWCGPCRQELPRLQAAYEAHRDEGLRVVAINVGEPLELAVPFAEDLGLTMPIGMFDEAMQPTLFGKVVPTLVIADREGNIRGRWDGFESSFEPEIDGLIRQLLAEEREPRRDVASVRRGAGRFGLWWFREMSAPIEDVLVTAGDTGAPAILVSHGTLMSFQARDGSTERQWAADRAAGLLRPRRSGAWPLASFRPGARKIVLFPEAGGEPVATDLADPVFDVAWLPDAFRGEAGALAAGTLRGVAVLDEKGRVTGRPEGFGAVAAVRATAAAGADLGFLVLESAGRLSWVDPSFRVVHQVETPPDPWRLIVGDAGAVGVASDEAVGATRGRFAADGGSAVALATRSGRLLIVSETDGRVLFEAEWPEIGPLAAGDLDGDGVDELVVTAGKWLGVLGVPVPRESHAAGEIRGASR